MRHQIRPARALCVFCNGKRAQTEGYSYCFHSPTIGSRERARTKSDVERRNSLKFKQRAREGSQIGEGSNRSAACCCGRPARSTGTAGGWPGLSDASLPSCPTRAALRRRRRSLTQAAAAAAALPTAGPPGRVMSLSANQRLWDAAEANDEAGARRALDGGGRADWRNPEDGYVRGCSERTAAADAPCAAACRSAPRS